MGDLLFDFLVLQAIRLSFNVSSCHGHHPKQLQREKTPDFVGPDLWPPNSPDLNLVDYKV